MKIAIIPFLAGFGATTAMWYPLVKHKGPQTLELNSDQHMTLEEGQTATIVKINGSWHVVSSGNTANRIEHMKYDKSNN